MTTFENQVLADLAVLKSQMASLLGNGQPGRLRRLEQRVEEHESWLQRGRGIALLLGLLFTLIHFGIEFWLPRP